MPEEKQDPTKQDPTLEGLDSEGLDAITRRRLLKGAGAFALAATSGSLLSACGGGGGGSSNTVAKSATNGPITGGTQAAEFRQLVGISDADVKALSGKDLKLGLITALTGSGAEYGRSQGNGFKLAAEHFQQATGLNIKTSILDHKSGDPQAGAQAIRQLGGESFGAVMSSYAADIGAMLPGFKQYKTMAFDPGGGTSIAFEGRPYFWGFRANTPNDVYPGLFQFVHQNIPQVKRVMFVGWDLGATLVGLEVKGIKQELSKYGMQYVGTQTVKIGATDVSAILSKIKTANPDLISMATYGTDPGYFMKQFAQAGIKAQVVGSEFTYDAQKVGGPAYNKYWFSSDYFTFDRPPNPLSNVFMKGYRAKFGKVANLFYEPNYYEGTLALLDLCRRVATKGGDINDGTKLQDACIANPVFKSVYGGDSKTVGEIELDPKTHTPVKRQMGVFAVQNGTPTPLAFFNIKGADYKLVKKPSAVG
jgi:ABC-type branched-subunit amino acid transport system substrate-binding protein